MRVLRFRHTGQDVKQLQKALLDLGHPLEIDGVFGVKTLGAVRKFQALNSLRIDGIAGYQTLKQLKLLKSVDPKYLMIHCSATPTHSAGSNAQSIIDYHKNTLNWGRAGYSKIIEVSGKVVEAHPLDLGDGFQPFEITYGAAELNPYSVHICYVGGVDDNFKPKDTRTGGQKKAMEKEVKAIIKECPDILVCGHNDFHSKACPSFDVASWAKSVKIAAKNIYKKGK